VSPAYCAVSACPPAASEGVAKIATPLPFVELAPSAVVPSRKVTVPVGVPVPGASALTVAVSVTVPPGTEGFTSEVSRAAVEACITVNG
jgi:hypothetical protein